MTLELQELGVHKVATSLSGTRKTVPFISAAERFTVFGDIIRRLNCLRMVALEDYNSTSKSATFEVCAGLTLPVNGDDEIYEVEFLSHKVNIIEESVSPLGYEWRLGRQDNTYEFFCLSDISEAGGFPFAA